MKRKIPWILNPLQVVTTIPLEQMVGEIVTNPRIRHRSTSMEVGPPTPGSSTLGLLTPEPLTPEPPTPPNSPVTLTSTGQHLPATKTPRLECSINIEILHPTQQNLASSIHLPPPPVPPTIQRDPVSPESQSQLPESVNDQQMECPENLGPSEPSNLILTNHLPITSIPPMLNQPPIPESSSRLNHSFITNPYLLQGLILPGTIWKYSFGRHLRKTEHIVFLPIFGVAKRIIYLKFSPTTIIYLNVEQVDASVSENNVYVSENGAVNIIGNSVERRFTIGQTRQLPFQKLVMPDRSYLERGIYLSVPGRSRVTLLTVCKKS